MFESGYLVRQVCPIKLSAWPREGCPDGPFVSQQENSTFFIFQLVVINFLITLQAWDVNISLQTFPEKKQVKPRFTTNSRAITSIKYGNDHKFPESLLQLA